MPCSVERRSISNLLYTRHVLPPTPILLMAFEGFISRGNSVPPCMQSELRQAIHGQCSRDTNMILSDLSTLFLSLFPYFSHLPSSPRFSVICFFSCSFIISLVPSLFLFISPLLCGFLSFSRCLSFHFFYFSISVSVLFSIYFLFLCPFFLSFFLPSSLALNIIVSFLHFSFYVSISFSLCFLFPFSVTLSFSLPLVRYFFLHFSLSIFSFFSFSCSFILSFLRSSFLLFYVSALKQHRQVT